MNTEIYAERALSALYPDLERLGAEYHVKHHLEGQVFIPQVMECYERLVGRDSLPQTALVLGCGPKPRAILAMRESGFSVVGVEPVGVNVASAQEFCGSAARILEGCAESLPVESASVSFVVMESVLEHVESVRKALDEAFRVLAPGGALFVYTTNRFKLSVRGFNGEYRTPFLNWFPRLLQECYVHHHLHFQPQLANFNARPAVHWFTYADLCAAGRDAGFATFYSLLDLVERDGTWARASSFRRLFVGHVRRRPWLRALALTQAGGAIFMVKRRA